MGIYSRDYIRERPGDGFSAGTARFTAIQLLLIANIAVFVLQNLYPAVTDWLSLSLSDLKQLQIWRLITYGFCHNVHGLSHIVFNLFVLWMFGRAIEPIYGSREFLAFYLAGIVVSGLGHVALALAAPVHAQAMVIGASGGVMAVVFLTAMNYPRMKVLLFFVIPIELRWLAVMYAAADVMGLADGNSNVANAAHLGGAAFGVAYHHFHWRILPLIVLRGRIPQWRLKRSPTNVRLYRPPDKQTMDKQVDAILEKISSHGEASLTEREREILREAGRRYRNQL